MRFVIIFIFFIRFTQIFSQNLTNEQDIFAILDAVKNEHIENKVLDDSFSEKLFNDFVNVLDEHHYYFTKSDYDLLIKNKLLLDNQLNNKKLEFIKAVNDFNNINNNLTNKNNELIDKWNKTAQSFLDKHVPKY
ncbi:MAG: hypothetical protein U0V72_03610 [Cytophagales bacterium]